MVQISIKSNAECKQCKNTTMKTICDKCANYEVSLCGTREICHAYIEKQTRFTNEITKQYIEQRVNGDKNHCKAYKKL